MFSATTHHKNKNDWRSDVDSALVARLNHLEIHNSKQKETIRFLRQENAKLKSDHHKKYVARQELKNSGYGGPWSDAQLDMILNAPPGCGRLRKGQSVKWSAKDIIKGISLYEKLVSQGMRVLM